MRQRTRMTTKQRCHLMKGFLTQASLCKHALLTKKGKGHEKFKILRSVLTTTICSFTNPYSTISLKYRDEYY
jgi:hypothetical protein